jgi:hypothetical protein
MTLRIGVVAAGTALVFAVVVAILTLTGSSGLFEHGRAIPPFSCLEAHGGNPQGVRVAVVGDSITARSAPEIAALLARDYSYRISGCGGFTMAGQLPTIMRLQGLGQGRPDDWIIELGTNASGSSRTPTWKTDFHNELAAVRSAKCVIFLTLSPFLGLASPVGPDINAAIAEAVATHRNFHSLDWGHIEYTDPGWTSPIDGIHPTPEGSAELASLEVQALHHYG